MTCLKMHLFFVQYISLSFKTYSELVKNLQCCERRSHLGKFKWNCFRCLVIYLIIVKMFRETLLSWQCPYLIVIMYSHSSIFKKSAFLSFKGYIRSWIFEGWLCPQKNTLRKRWSISTFMSNWSFYNLLFSR